MKVGIIGAGAYALALAHVLKKNNDVIIWTKLEDEYRELKEKRTNEKVLPNFKLDSNIKITLDLKEVTKVDLVIVAIPAKFVDSISKELKGLIKKQYICIATKGIEQETCLFPIDVFKKYNKSTNIALISGPSFAADIITNILFFY